MSCRLSRRPAVACISTRTGSVNANVDPLPRDRFHPDASAVHLDDAPRDGQAQAGAPLLAGIGAVGLLELVEDPLPVSRRDPRAGVRNGHDEPAGRGRRPDADAAGAR